MRRYVGIGMLLIGIAGIVASATAKDDFGAGLLGELPVLKDYTAGRQSSFDPSEGNSDGRQDWPIQPGETRELAVVEGAGAITHIWVTIASKDPNHLRNLVLRMYWDGESSPSVESPIGDFFGQGHGKYYQYACLPIQIGTSNGLNCFWRMPFTAGARVTVTNDGPLPVGAFYYYVDYQQYKKLPPDTAYFHAHYRQEYPCTPGQNYLFMEAKGRGHYVGCNLSIHNRTDGWWGEGDDMIYIDGSEKPILHGTGSEDYFCGAWCYGPAFSDLFLGCPLRGEHKKNALWNVYRYHLTDPIPFESEIRVTIEHGHANDRNDDFSSVAYWYQTEPHAAFGPLPKAEDRLPSEAKVFVETGATEIEDLAPMIKADDVEVQDMGHYKQEWSDGKHLWFRPGAPATYAIPLPPAETSDAGTYKVELWYTVAPDYGTCELWLNGEKVTSWDGYHEEGVEREKLEFPVALKPGDNTLELRVTGKNEASKGFLAGLDCYRVTRM